LIFIPDFSFTLSAVERRKPLPSTARRAGWVGCNILLDRIPIDARILHREKKIDLPHSQKSAAPTVASNQNSPTSNSKNAAGP